ncbi:hypothetical protein ATANTOWER_018646 [Ataeniobius toweri]|uniref:Uncharacterized protein n=1 Tax=Ataeniobius toweri TaxID=208326 RepID=A0ABU7ARI1_9TELE|nr:hypothetical protein [Ataeniobius toweri]
MTLLTNTIHYTLPQQKNHLKCLVKFDFFNGNMPTSVVEFLFVCLKYLKDEFISNFHQYQEGFARRHNLIKGSVPSVYGNNGLSKTVITNNAKMTTNLVLDMNLLCVDMKSRPQTCKAG